MDILIREYHGEILEVEIERDATQGSEIVFVREAASDNETRMALEIGRKVMEHVEEGMAVGDAHLTRETNMGIPVEKYAIILPVLPKKSKPLKGKKWLESLPPGTIIQPDGYAPILILWDGFGYKSGGRWEWDSVVETACDWIGLACPETCPIWEPETNDTQ